MIGSRWEGDRVKYISTSTWEIEDSECEAHTNTSGLSIGGSRTCIRSYYNALPGICKTNSGSPIVETHRCSNFCYFPVQFGIIIQGSSCGFVNISVVTRVSNYVDWIDSIIFGHELVINKSVESRDQVKQHKTRFDPQLEEVYEYNESPHEPYGAKFDAIDNSESSVEQTKQPNNQTDFLDKLQPGDYNAWVDSVISGKEFLKPEVIESKNNASTDTIVFDDEFRPGKPGERNRHQVDDFEVDIDIRMYENDSKFAKNTQLPFRNKMQSNISSTSLMEQKFAKNITAVDEVEPKEVSSNQFVAPRLSKKFPTTAKFEGHTQKHNPENMRQPMRTSQKLVDEKWELNKENVRPIQTSQQVFEKRTQLPSESYPRIERPQQLATRRGKLYERYDGGQRSPTSNYVPTIRRYDNPLFFRSMPLTQSHHHYPYVKNLISVKKVYHEVNTHIAENRVHNKHVSYENVEWKRYH